MIKLTRVEDKGLLCTALFLPVWYIGLIVLCAALLIWLVASASASSQSTMMLGVDVSPGANHSSSIGDIETCDSHEVGDEFTVDVFVNNVIELTSWELRLDYDSNVVQVMDADFNYFLVSTPPGGNVFPILFESELPGRQFLAAAEVSGPPDSGSGVLARVSMTAVGQGVSGLSVVTHPVYFAPRLTNKTGAAVGDGNSDGYWDGSIIGGEIRVGKSCSSDAPVVTPKPSLAPGTTPNPGPGESGGDGSSGDGSSVDGSDAVVIVPGGGSGSGEGGSGSSGGEAGRGSGSDSDPGSAGDGGAGSGDDGSDSGDGADDGFDGDGAFNAADDDGFSGVALVVLGLGAAALALGALVYALSLRSRG